MLTGKQPRRGKTAMEMIRKAQTEPPVPASKVNPEVPKALEAICQKAMAHERAERYQSASEMADDVERYIAGEPVSAYPEPLTTRTWRWAMRHRKLLALGGGPVACGRRGIGVREGPRGRAKPRRRLAKACGGRGDRPRSGDLKEFRRLADEARFFAATTDPVSEDTPYFDPAQGEKYAEAALAFAEERWGSGPTGFR